LFSTIFHGVARALVGKRRHRDLARDDAVDLVAGQ
jgi:hypothetical protein